MSSKAYEFSTFSPRSLEASKPRSLEHRKSQISHPPNIEHPITSSPSHLRKYLPDLISRPNYSMDPYPSITIHNHPNPYPSKIYGSSIGASNPPRIFLQYRTHLSLASKPRSLEMPLSMSMDAHGCPWMPPERYRCQTSNIENLRFRIHPEFNYSIPDLISSPNFYPYPSISIHNHP